MAVKSGKASFMATNMIVNSTTGVTASSQATGAISKAQKEGAGSASAILGGTYAGVNTIDFYVEIESTGEIGVATFKWSNDGGATFTGTGVATSTSPVTLQDGVTIQWTQGAGNDVVIGDNWRFKAYLPYGRNKILDRDRDTEWRSTGVAAESLTFDLGSAQTPTVLVILDHNLSASGSFRLQGSNASNFATLVSDYVVPYQANHVLYFLGAPLLAARYWRIQMADAGNSDGYLRLSEVFLGAYTRLTQTFALGDLRGRQRVGQRDRNLGGKFYGAANAVSNVFDLSWIRLSQDERDALMAVFDALTDLTNRAILPVFFSPLDTDTTKIYLCEWSDQQAIHSSETDAPEYYQIPVRLAEIPRTLDTL